jgi:hypothetical protein
MSEVDRQASATAGFAITDSQGAAGASGGVPGQGLLLDIGGTDRYIASSYSSAAASPESAVVTKDVTSSAQGSVSGNSQALLYDDDDGEKDVFTSSPGDPACTGTRGEGTWQDCGAGVGLGVVDDEPDEGPWTGSARFAWSLLSPLLSGA